MFDCNKINYYSKRYNNFFQHILFKVPIAYYYSVNMEVSLGENV